jgi:uncharacterized membrane protein
MAMSSSNGAQTPGEKDTGRLEAFSDGVFSIAMTLLVLELTPPTLKGTATPAALWAALAKLWPSYFAFVTSFFTVLIMWVNHHSMFRLIHRTSARLMFANGLLLLLVTVVPFPTALVATYLKTSAAGAACTVYAGTFVVISISYALVLHAAAGGGHLLVPGSSPQVRRKLRDCYLVGLPLYSLAALIASFIPWLSLAICSALWIFWCLAPAERGAGFSS